MYRWANSQRTVLKRSMDETNTNIPAYETNSDYREYLEWVAQGNVAEDYQPPAPTANEIRAECQRRIMIITGTPGDFQRCMVKQLNALMRAAELVNKKALGEELTESELAEEQILMNLANAIKALRAKSNILEANPPIDYTDDQYWT